MLSWVVPIPRTMLIVVPSDSTFLDRDQIGTEWYQNAVEARGAGMAPLMVCVRMSAFGGKADMLFCAANVR